MMKTNFNLQWILLAILLYSGGIAIYNFLILKPRISEYKRLKREKALMADTYVNRRSKKVNILISYLERQLEHLRKQRQDVFSHALKAGQFPLLINEMETKVRESGGLITSSDVRIENSVVKGFEIGRFRLEIENDFAGLLTFLNKIDRSRSQFFIAELKIKARESKLHIKMKILAPLISNLKNEQRKK